MNNTLTKSAHKPRLLCLLVGSLLCASTQAQAPVIDDSAAALGLSDYRHFIVYPHLERAMRALKNNDEATALREFERAHKKAPQNVQLTLYLAEAMRHFGHDEQARALLTAQLKINVGDKRLLTSLNAIPRKQENITNAAELLAQQKRCEQAPSTQCRSEVGENALRLGELDVALQQLNHADFAAAPQGKALSENLLQRAIYLKRWTLAESLLSRKQQQLTPAEQQQWFDVLIAGHLDERLLALQAKGIFNRPDERIDYATSLAERGEISRLRNYLSQPPATFSSAAQEQRWLYLIGRYSADPQTQLASYTARFAQNQRYIVGETLPQMMKVKNYAGAQRLLDSLPADTLLEERYTISEATHNTAETLRLARQFWRDNPTLANLDRLSWQLIQAGRPQEAAALLLQRYPFGNDASAARPLIMRLFNLVQANPDALTPAQKARLLKPLATPELRLAQSRLPGVSNDCAQIQRLLGDMPATLDAGAWSMLGNCWRDSLPGMSLYAFLKSEAQQPDSNSHRAVAYQAYQVQDYATAMRAWKAVPLNEMRNNDVIAAANTAQAAGDQRALDGWLQEEQKRGMDNTEHYWWLHAQRYVSSNPELALASLDRAIAIEPTTRAYLSRVQIHRKQGRNQAAADDLRQALLKEPENSAIQASLGYALWATGDAAGSREMLEKARSNLPDDPALVRQLAYVNQRLDDIPQTQRYARLVVDDLDRQAQIAPLTAAQKQERFNFRRLHEDVARRWTINFDSTLGLRSGALSSANNIPGGTSEGQSYRSYGQLEIDYRAGRNVLIDGDAVSLYGRLFADTGESGVMLPVKDPMLGAGVRWKPLRDYVFFLALEQQTPLDSNRGQSDTMLRASASLFNDGKYSDEWHPNGRGWFAQNLYLDAAHYIRQDYQAWTADYRVSWHQKIAQGQTIEPYAHAQISGYRDGYTRGGEYAGVGVRWNIWSGQTRYDAWPHKVSVGLEYQRTLNTINQNAGERNNAFLTLGVHW